MKKQKEHSRLFMAVVLTLMCLVYATCMMPADSYAKTITVKKGSVKVTLEGTITGNVSKGYYLKMTENVSVKVSGKKYKCKKFKINATKAKLKSLKKFNNKKVKINATLVAKKKNITLSKVKKITLVEEKVQKLNGTVKASFSDATVANAINCELKYSDDYFSGNASALSDDIQGNIAKLSIVASATMYNQEFATAFMEKELKFSNVKYVTHEASAADPDHSNYMIGYKNIDDYTLVSVWVRGSVGGMNPISPDWTSNFNIGEGAVHAGFSKAEEELSNEVTAYITELKNGKLAKDNIKFWITGHSRGGAIANLFGARMTQAYGKEKVYADTFASPYVSRVAVSEGFENIINYVNPGDVVAALPPAVLQYKRFGKDYAFTDKYAEMSQIYMAKTGMPFVGNYTKDVVDVINASIKSPTDIVTYFAGISNTPEYLKIAQAHAPSLYMSWLEAIYQ